METWKHWIMEIQYLIFQCLISQDEPFRELDKVYIYLQYLWKHVSVVALDGAAIQCFQEWNTTKMFYFGSLSMVRISLFLVYISNLTVNLLKAVNIKITTAVFFSPFCLSFVYVHLMTYVAWLWSNNAATLIPSDLCLFPQEVIDLTKDLLSSQPPDPATSSTNGVDTAPVKHIWKVGDKCLAVWSQDGQWVSPASSQLP